MSVISIGLRGGQSKMENQQVENILKEFFSTRKASLSWDRKKIRFKFIRLNPITLLDFDIGIREFIGNSLEEVNKLLSKTGFKVNGLLKFGIEDYRIFLAYIFGDYDIIDCQGKYVSEVGHPDFMLKSKDGKHQFYLELKFAKDSIKQSQLEWFVKNQDKETWFGLLEFSPQCEMTKDADY